MNIQQYKTKLFGLLDKLKNELPESERLAIILEIEEMLAALLPE